MMPFPTDLAIASQATLKPLTEIAADAGIPAEMLEPYGTGAAKVSLDAVEAMARAGRPRGPLRGRVGHHTDASR